MRKVLVIGTGGTISCVDTENGLAPGRPVSELIKDIELPVEIHTEQLFELDSTDMTPRHWEQLARRIRERYDEFDGFVVTHGTDTMAYGASALSVLIQNSRKPIVFTGGMEPMGDRETDSFWNLLDSIKVAADSRFCKVLIVFSMEILEAHAAHKRYTYCPDCFDNVMDVYAGEITPYDVRTPNVRCTGETGFYEHLSDDVFLAKLIPGQRLYVPENARAVILESYGAGGVPDYLFDDVAALAKRGVYVIIGTQCERDGTRLSEYAVGRRALKSFPVLETGEMSTEYSVARAQWALAYSDNYEDFKKLFCIDVRA